MNRIRLLLLLSPLIPLVAGAYIYTHQDAYLRGTGGPGPGLVVAAVIGIMVLTAVITFIVIARNTAQKKRIREQGISGTARIIDSGPTGIRINQVPQLRLRLSVHSSLGQQYEVTIHKVIDPVCYRLNKPGTEIPVMIDPQNEKRLYLDLETAWQQQVPPAGTGLSI